jgi:exosome complex component RRP4
MSNNSLLHHHFVLPGQVLATSHSESDGGFLRGHGTYIELVPDDEDDDDEDDDDDALNGRHGGGGGGMAGTSTSLGKMKKKKSSSSSSGMGDGWGNFDTSNVVMQSAVDHDKDCGGGGGDANMDDNTNDDNANNDDDQQQESLLLSKGPQRLIASVAGTVERVNKLISVIPLSPSIYNGQVGDLVIGRIVGVGGSRWKVSLTCSSPSSSGSNGSMKEGQLPLSGVNLPGGVQRIRTSEDVLAMRSLYREGDLLTCEVQQVQRDGTLILHTRSLRYGKLENGVLVTVPPHLVGRRKNHFVTLRGIVGAKRRGGSGIGNADAMNIENPGVDEDGDDNDDDGSNVDVYLGLNGGIWIQRTVPSRWENAIRADQDERAPLAETLQKLRQLHASTRVSPAMREGIARVRNSIDCLRLVHCQITPDSIEVVARASLDAEVRVADMLLPEWVVKLTEGTRRH